MVTYLHVTYDFFLGEMIERKKETIIGATPSRTKNKKKVLFAHGFEKFWSIILKN